MMTRSVSRWIMFADICWCLAAFVGAEALRYHRFWDPANRSTLEVLLPFLAGTAVLWFFLSSWMKLDCFRGGWRFSAVVSQVSLAVLCLMSVLLSAGYLEREYVSRLALTYFGILLLVGFVLIRYIARFLLVARHRTGAVRRAVVVGTDRIARELALKIKRHPELVCEVIGFLCPEHEGDLASVDCEAAVRVPTIGVVDLLSDQRVSDVIFALPKPSVPEVVNLAGRCRERGISVSFVPQPYELYLSRPALLDLDGIPILELQATGPSEFFLLCKRMVDIVLGSALSVFAVPILLPVWLGMRLTKSQVFRWERRCGMHGKSFSVLRLNVDRENTHNTSFERLLVKMSVTELPQLWNVLRGEMSLVGPRPDPPERVRQYSEWSQRRLSIKPGMTGLAQVHGLRDQNSSEDKTRFDLQYILNPSALTDVSILLQTFWTLAARLFQYSKFAGSKPNSERLPLFNAATPHPPGGDV